jgi:exodeoxyribonuclease VII large subunit
MRRCIDQRIAGGLHDLSHLRARLRTLSPAATLDRGYAVVLTPDGHVVRDAAMLEVGSDVDVRVATGGFTARVEDLR